MTIKKMYILLFVFALVAAEPVTKSFNVKGMMCGYGCVTTINNSVKSLEGVENCNVDFESKLMTVTFENKLLNESKIIESLPTPYIASLLVDLTKKEYDVLAKSIKRVLKKAIKAGGTSISDFKNLDGGVGYFSQKLKIYGLDKCGICGEKTYNITIAGRSSYYCKKCQR